MNTSEFLREQYLDEDRLAIVQLHERAGVVQHIKPVREIVTDLYQGYLEENNQHGWNVHYSPNVLRMSATHRTKEDFSEVKALWADLDLEGDKQLGRMWERDSLVPKPSYVINTSPGHFQAVWKVKGFKEHADAEKVLRGIAVEYGGDPGALDWSHTLRLPGFRNMKETAHGHLVEVARIDGPTHTPDDFRVRRDIERLPDEMRRRGHTQADGFDRFRGDFLVAKSMARMGKSKDEATREVFDRAHARWGGPEAKRQDYARSTVDRAYHSHGR